MVKAVICRLRSALKVFWNVQTLDRATCNPPRDTCRFSSGWRGENKIILTILSFGVTANLRSPFYQIIPTAPLLKHGANPNPADGQFQFLSEDSAMPPFSPATKALGSFLSRRTSIGRLIRRHTSSCLIGRWDGSRCWGCSGVAGIGSSFGSGQSSPHKDAGVLAGSLWTANNIQRRQFLGCGDGEEGGFLSKVYEERRVLGYSPTQLFDVVAAVDMYQDFLPWCQRSEILRSYPDGSLDAELEIGFKFLVESYISHVDLKRPHFIKSAASDSTLFEHLINIWEFNPGPSPGSCDLHFLVDFKFQSPLYSQVASVFFKEVVARLVGSFSERCRLIYGPEVPILEEPYRQRA